MPPHLRLLYSGLMAGFLVLAGLPVVRELARPRDIWWTPKALMIPLDQGRDRVEIYARGRSLGALLEAGQLRVGEGSGSTVLAKSDIGLRLNNSDRVRAERLPVLLGSAAMCGVLGTLLLLVATERLGYRGERTST